MCKARARSFDQFDRCRKKALALSRPLHSQGLHFRRQVPIDHLIVDFLVFPRASLSRSMAASTTPHLVNASIARAIGICMQNDFKVLRFWNNDVHRQYRWRRTRNSIRTRIMRYPHPHPLPARGRGRSARRARRDHPLQAGRAGHRPATLQGAMHHGDRGLSEEQRMMRQSCRDFVDHVVLPFIRRTGSANGRWCRKTGCRCASSKRADKIGIRTLGVPEEFGGVELEKGTEVKTFAMIAEEIARGDSGLADKLVQNWKVSVLLRQVAPRHLQEKWFPRLVDDRFPDGALPDRAARRLRPLAALRRAGSGDADQGRQGQRVGDQRPQAVHQQRLRCALYVVYANTKPGRHAKGTSSFLVPRETPGFSVPRCNETLGGRFMNNGEMVFEDCACRRTTAWWRTARRARRRLFPSRQDHPGVEEPGHRRRRVRGDRRLRAELRAGRAHPDQAPGGRDAARRNGNQDQAVRALLERAARGRRKRAGSGDAGQHGQAVCLGGDLKVCQHAVELHGGNGIMLDFGIEKLCATPPCSCTWTRPWISPNSRSSSACSRHRGRLRRARGVMLRIQHLN